MDKSITIIDCNEIKVPFDLKIGEEELTEKEIEVLHTGDIIMLVEKKEDRELKRITKYCNKALKTKKYQFNILLHLYNCYKDIKVLEKRFDTILENSVNEEYYITDSDFLNDSALTIEINGMDKEIRKKLLKKFKYFYCSGINNFIRD